MRQLNLIFEIFLILKVCRFCIVSLLSFEPCDDNSLFCTAMYTVFVFVCTENNKTSWLDSTGLEGPPGLRAERGTSTDVTWHSGTQWLQRQIWLCLHPCHPFCLFTSRYKRTYLILFLWHRFISILSPPHATNEFHPQLEYKRGHKILTVNGGVLLALNWFFTFLLF